MHLNTTSWSQPAEQTFTQRRFSVQWTHVCVLVWRWTGMAHGLKPTEPRSDQFGHKPWCSEIVDKGKKTYVWINDVFLLNHFNKLFSTTVLLFWVKKRPHCLMELNTHTRDCCHNTHTCTQTHTHSLWHTHTHFLSLSDTHTNTHTHTHSHTLSLWPTLLDSLSLTHTNKHTNTLSLTHAHTHKQTNTHTLLDTLTHTHSLWHTYLYTLSDTHIHTHTHSLFDILRHSLTHSYTHTHL